MLPFISISSPFGRPLRFLIDTGASSSFINPEFIHPDDVLNCSPIKITTIFTNHTLNREILLPKFVEFNQSGKLRFLVFKFHAYFDGLLGLDALKSLRAKVDLANQTLITENSKIPLKLKPNLTSKHYGIPPNSKLVVELPVDVESGNIYMHNIEIKPKLTIPEDIYLAKNWYSHFEVINSSETEQTLFIEQPLKVEKFTSDKFTEVNNFNVTYNLDSMSSLPNNISNLLRTCVMLKQGIIRPHAQTRNNSA